MDHDYSKILKDFQAHVEMTKVAPPIRFDEAAAKARAAEEKLLAQEIKMQQLQAMLMQQIQSQKKASFMSQMNPGEEAINLMYDLARAIDALYDWGQNAKDPLGNFLPDSISSDVRSKFHKLKWLLEGAFSSGFPRSGSSGRRQHK